MNREWVLFHLGEASEELVRTIDEIRESPDYGASELAVTMMHLYHHLNTAWNARDATVDKVANDQKHFRAWSQYPTDLATME